jgi:hypothetical protein
MSIATDSPNIRISSRSKATLRELAKREGKPMQTVLDDAIEHYRRDRFFRELDASFGQPVIDPDQQLWETTLGDGLDED